ncbi:MAG: hypothetical protein U0V48_08920 [Anaerolineales bacterium]
MTQKSFQEYYPESYAHCYGCGTLNEHGHHIQSYWDGDRSVCHFMPKYITSRSPATSTADCSPR